MLADAASLLGLPLSGWLLLLAGAAAGGFINGLAGFGTALFALGFWLQVLPAVEAVALVLALSVVGGVQGLAQVREGIQPHRLLRFLLPGLVGVLIGLLAVPYIRADALKLFVGLLLIVYGLFFSFRSALPTIERRTPRLDALVGLLGGLLGGAAGLSGAVMTMWCATKPWRKVETRAVLQPFNFAILGFSLLLYVARGHYSLALLVKTLVVVPVTLLFVQMGIRTFRRLSDRQFRRLLVLLMLCSGLLLTLRNLTAFAAG